MPNFNPAAGPSLPSELLWSTKYIVSNEAPLVCGYMQVDIIGFVQTRPDCLKTCSTSFRKSLVGTTTYAYIYIYTYVCTMNIVSYACGYMDGAYHSYIEQTAFCNVHNHT